METKSNTKKGKALRSNGTLPSLFYIPLNVYSDEMEKDRDKEAFLKIQQLEKKCEQLRQKLYSDSEQNGCRIETTRNLIIRTIAFNKYLSVKKHSNSFNKFE